MISNQLSVNEIALICPLVVTFTWSFPLIFSPASQDNSKHWLGFFLLNMFVFFLATSSFYFASYRVFIFLDPFFMFSLLAIFPFLYFFIYSIINPESGCRYKHILHSFPSLLFLAGATIVYALILDDETKYYYVNQYLMGEGELTPKISLIETINMLSKVVFIMQAIVYFILIRKMMVEYKEKISSYHSNLERLNIKWAKLFYLVYGTAVCIGIPALIGGHKTISQNGAFTAITMFSLAFVFYIIAWIGYIQQTNQEHFNHDIELKDSDVEEPQELKNRLIRFFENNKPFLNPDLKIHDIYMELNTNRTYLSRLINNEFNTNFCMFVNKYRIVEAKKKFSIAESNKYKTEEIGRLVGFNSYQSFVKAFRLFENSTPSKYRKEREE
ncbi:MAG: AraC family transcriptional regulator [Bacteroidales bacterium]|nr:AraC family transcriptional regulator [Bacteroidales bacterium]